ncbi:MAG: T9SS type A sorting domain-containing protein [Ignavibacteriales bacterium]|nr:T9SS type A sorting domain-containing protein [Ignavibacteriales bacterium]
MKKSLKGFFCFFIILLATTLRVPLQAQDCNENKTQSHRLAKTTTNDFYAAFLINNIFNYYSNNGDGSFNPYANDDEGFEWPKGGGTGKTAAFEDGLIWVCRQNGTLKANGSSYWHGLQAGKILSNGSADDPSLPKYRVYRVRPDIGPTTTWGTAMKQKIQSQEGDLIRRYQSFTDSVIYVQYIKDWNEWPAADGAPYTDVNGNGVYDPSVDIPGVPGADQTLWHVSNDMNVQRAYSMGGATPIGLEVQRTIWGYNRLGLLGNIIFTKYRIVNKSGARLDSMYIGQWADPDLGGVAGTIYDTPGCDSTLSLGYVYSGREVYGGWGSPLPAFGYVLVQGPLVPGSFSDSAITSSGFRRGYRNLPMTSFIFTICGNATYVDASAGKPQSTIDLYNVLRGLGTKTGTPFIDPSTGNVTKYLASGDPVTGKGWIAPSDECTFTFSSGPFTLAAGDTQEVVVAATIAMGADRISSVTALKASAVQLRSSYRGTSQVLSPPSMAVTPTYTSGQNTQLALTADCRGLNVKSIDAFLRRSDGSTAASVQLYDDGTHGDGQAGDGMFAATYSLPQQSSGLSVDANVVYTNSSSTAWPGLVNNVTTAGPVLVTSPVIVSDNLNSDGIANPGEDIRIGFTLVNNSTATLQNLSVTLLSTSGSAFVGTVNAYSSVALKYDPPDATTYLTFIVPSATTDTIISFSLLIKDPTGNRWSSSFTIPVKLMRYPLVNQVVTRVSGLDGGDFAISIVDPAKVKSHVYYIYGLDSVGASKARGYRLLDSLTGTVLIDNHSLPDALGHTSPVVDGLKILSGTISNVEGGFFRVSVPQYAGTSVKPAFDILRNVWSDGMWSFDSPFSTIQAYALGRFNWQNNTTHDYEIRITSNDNTGSEYYLGSDGGALAGNAKASSRIPLQVWDVTKNMRLIVKVYQTKVVSTSYDTLGGGALTNLGVGVGWNQLFGSSAIPYAEPLPAISPVETPANTSVLGRMVFVDWKGKRYLPPAGTVIRISSHHLVSSADSWSFNPAQILAGSPQPVVPTSFSLSQNYPNPFNPSTTIRFELAQHSSVKLKVFNVLGQLLATLVDKQRNAGFYLVEWNAQGTASGVYFYQLQAGDVIQTKKMILMK